MIEKAPNPADTRPMTVGHGRWLHNQQKEIEAKLDLLMPLLRLLEVPVLEEGADPIEAILRLLDTLSVQGTQVVTYLDEIDAKLVLLLANSGINAP